VSNEGANTWATAIGPDDALYVGAWGCGDEIPAQVIRIDDNGTRTVYVDGLRDEVRDIAFAPDGSLYIATYNRRQGTLLFYVPPKGGTPVQIPITPELSITSIAVDPASGNLLASESQGSAILEFTRNGSVTRHPIQLPKAVFDLLIDIAPDGTLYAYCSEAERQKTGPIVTLWVLKVDWKNGLTKIVTQIDYPGCCVMGNLSVDSRGEVWWLYDPKLSIYRVTADGQRTLFAQNLPIDPAGIAVDRQGDVYFTSSGGIYRIYRAP
jgi:streptogramin lyase